MIQKLRNGAAGGCSTRDRARTGAAAGDDDLSVERDHGGVIALGRQAGKLSHLSLAGS